MSNLVDFSDIKLDLGDVQPTMDSAKMQAAMEDIMAGFNPWYANWAQAVSYTHLDVYKRQKMDMDPTPTDTVKNAWPIAANTASTNVPHPPSNSFAKSGDVYKRQPTYRAKFRPCT